MGKTAPASALCARLRGLVPVMPTPLRADESLDEEGMARLADFTLRYPFSAVWCLATAGEDENLPEAMIERCAALFVRHFGGKIPVLVKTSTPGTRETIARTRRMAALGFDAAIIHFQHKHLGVEHARRYFLAVAEASPTPILVYHNSERGAQLDLELMLELSRHPNIAGMKAGGSNIAELQRLCLFADPGFAVMTAGGGQILAGLSMGAAAHTAIPLLAFPERAFALVESLRAGRLGAARAQQKIILDFIARMPKLQNREVNGETKAVLELRGVIGRDVSAPFLAATEEQVARLRSLIAELDLFGTGETPV